MSSAIRSRSEAVGSSSRKPPREAARNKPASPVAPRFSNEIRRLGEHERGNDERACLASEQLGAGSVIRIVPDGRGDKRPGVDDESYGVNPSASSRSSASRAEKPFAASPSCNRRDERALAFDDLQVVKP